jgi:hypothetical protein
MADPEDPFLARWSRRKRSPRRDRPAPDAEPERRDSDAVTAAPAEDTPPADVAEPGVAEPGAAAEPLPDIDSLDKTSDFSVFLKEGVPEAIRRKALRRLWRLDPVLANLDGLNDYDEDFSVLGMVAGQLKTIYKVGKGYLDEDEAPGDEVPVAQTAGESSTAGKDDSGKEAGAEPATDGGPEPGLPEPGSPEPESSEPESPETAGPGSAAADSAPRSGKLQSGKSQPGKSRSAKLPGRSARNRRWGGFAS